MLATSQPRSWTAQAHGVFTLLQIGLGFAGSGRLHLSHQVVVPYALDLEVGGGAKLEGFDHIMVDVGGHARLAELVEGRAGRAAPDEPSLKASQRGVRETSGLQT